MIAKLPHPLLAQTKLPQLSSLIELELCLPKNILSKASISIRPKVVNKAMDTVILQVTQPE